MAGVFGMLMGAGATARGYRRLPEQRRANAAIVTFSYWQASVLDEFGRRYGLPRVYSPDRGFGYFGAPPERARTVVAVGGDRKQFGRICGTLRPLARSTAPKGLPGASDGVTIRRCTDPVAPWPEPWPKLRSM